MRTPHGQRAKDKGIPEWPAGLGYRERRAIRRIGLGAWIMKWRVSQRMRRAMGDTK